MQIFVYGHSMHIIAKHPFVSHPVSPKLGVVKKNGIYRTRSSWRGSFGEIIHFSVSKIRYGDVKKYVRQICRQLYLSQTVKGNKK
jgi:hypothetical protein